MVWWGESKRLIELRGGVRHEVGETGSVEHEAVSRAVQDEVIERAGIDVSDEEVIGIGGSQCAGR